MKLPVDSSLKILELSSDVCFHIFVKILIVFILKRQIWHPLEVVVNDRAEMLIISYIIS